MRSCGIASNLSSAQHQIPLLSRNARLQLVYAGQLVSRWLGSGTPTPRERCQELGVAPVQTSFLPLPKKEIFIYKFNYVAECEL